MNLKPKASSINKWTPEQRCAIETTGCNLLVSAAAGSGKTSVLAERCVHLICDSKPRAHVSQLLEILATGTPQPPTYGNGAVSTARGSLLDEAA